MFVLFAFLGLAAAAPAIYDQRQEGEFNVQADVQNIVLLIAIPQKVPNSILDLGWLKKSKHSQDDIQERADVQVMEAFVEPNTPYHVEIGEGKKQVEGDGRNAEVVIPGRKPIEAEDDVKSEDDVGEFKLIGATEQCGPERERDPETLMCRDIVEDNHTKAPEVVPVSS